MIGKCGKGQLLIQAGKNAPALSTLRASTDGEVNGKMTGVPERFPYSFHRREEGRNFMVFDSCTSSLPPFSGWRTMRARRRLTRKVPKPRNFTSDRLRTDRAIVSSTAFNACSACREVTSFPSSRWSSRINCVLFIGLPV